MAHLKRSTAFVRSSFLFAAVGEVEVPSTNPPFLSLSSPLHSRVTYISSALAFLFTTKAGSVVPSPAHTKRSSSSSLIRIFALLPSSFLLLLGVVQRRADRGFLQIKLLTSISAPLWFFRVFLVAEIGDGRNKDRVLWATAGLGGAPTLIGSPPLQNQVSNTPPCCYPVYKDEHDRVK